MKFFLTLSLILLSFTLAQARELALSDIKISNAVSECVTITPQKIETSGSIVKLTADLKEIKKVGECRCMSVLLSYSVIETIPMEGEEPLNFERVFASFNSQTTPMDFMIASDPSLILINPLTLKIYCARPD